MARLLLVVVAHPPPVVPVILRERMYNSWRYIAFSLERDTSETIQIESTWLGEHFVGPPPVVRIDITMLHCGFKAENNGQSFIGNFLRRECVIRVGDWFLATATPAK